MKLSFENIIDKHKNIPALIVAHGPSLNLYSSQLPHLCKKSIIFDCNEWMYFHSTIPNYWVVANSVLTVQTWRDQFNSYANKSTLIYSDSVDTTDSNWVAQNLSIDYLPYNQRHFGNNITIQETLRRYCNVNHHYSSGDTVALHQLACAILMGCNPIYFIGIDLDYTSYASNSVNMIPYTQDISNYYTNILNDLSIINESAKNIDVDILNLNPNSKFGIFNKGELT